MDHDRSINLFKAFFKELRSVFSGRLEMMGIMGGGDMHWSEYLPSLKLIIGVRMILQWRLFIPSQFTAD